MEKTLKLLLKLMVVLMFSFSLTGCPPYIEEILIENDKIIDDDKDNNNKDDESDIKNEDDLNDKDDSDNTDDQDNEDDNDYPDDPNDQEGENEDEDNQDEQIIDPTLEEIIAQQLNDQEGKKANPAYLKLDVDLGTMKNPDDTWHRILKAIETEGKYINLDLSDCKMSYDFFDPDYTITDGKEKIIKITLPDDAVNIIGVDDINTDKRAFINFSNLEFAGGKNITHIGSYAFRLSVKLISVDFPALENIDNEVFAGCFSLIEVEFPLLTSMGNNTFNVCSNLKTVNFPELLKIKPYTFSDCAGLEKADIPKAVYIDQYAFQNCENLIIADFPLVETLGNQAFENCIKLETALFPKLEKIYARTFFNCVSLKNIDFSSVVHIADHAFYNCTSLEEVIFPKAMIIEPMSFANCTSLTTARFLADPEPPKDADLIPIHPLYPWLNNIPGLPCVSESVLFYNNAFNGCTSLITLDVRNAWNVYFVGQALANIGKTLEIYLFDDDGTKSFGHPPIDIIFGNSETQTLESIKFIFPDTPIGLSKADSANGGQTGYHGIAVYAPGLGVSVTIERLP